jgi:hypothetical protein
MNQKTVRNVILALGLITAFVHLVILNFVVMGHLDPKFTLNGLGYLALLWAFFANPSFVQGRRPLLHYVFIGYTVLTILAWFVYGKMGDPLGLLTKLDEVLLIAALVYNLRLEKPAGGKDPGVRPA